MAKRILSVSYDASLLFTRQLLLEQMGYDVVSAEGFAEAWEICESKNAIFDLAILGHSIPTKDRQRIIDQLREQCPCPVLALLRPHESPMQSADQSVEASEPEKLVKAVRTMLS